MQQRLLYGFLVAVIAAIPLVLGAGCAKNEEQQVEAKGRIEQATDQAAGNAVKKIRTPMDKARATQNLGNERLEAMDKTLQKQ